MNIHWIPRQPAEVPIGASPAPARDSPGQQDDAKRASSNAGRFLPVFGGYPQAILLILLAMVFFLGTAPWRALQCGGDEGMEFSKMLLLLRHPELVHLAWNDQPWFYSQVFASIFTLTGFQPGIPRLATFLIVCGMLLGFRRLMPSEAGWLPLLCGWAFFWCWPGMPSLSVSAMLEVPAFGLAMIAAALSPRGRTEWRCWRFCCVGLLLAVAVQIKLTAALVFPALVIKVAWVWWREIYRQRKVESPDAGRLLNHWWLGPFLGVSVFGLVFGMIMWWSPDWDWSWLLGNHLAAAVTPQAEEHRFSPASLLESPGTVVGAILSFAVLGKQRRLSEAIFPVVLFGTVFLVHLNFHPWWSYYAVHFAVPLAILGGWGGGELFRQMQMEAGASETERRHFFSRNSSMMLGTLVIALWTGFELPRGYAQTWEVSQHQPAAENDEIRVLEKYQSRTKWAFTRHNIMAAQAGYVLPPELTVLPQKRFWTGAITEKSILGVVKKYGCEVLILNSQIELARKDWSSYVSENYVRVWSGDYESIFVARRLNPQPPPNKNELLKKLGIY